MSESENRLYLPKWMLDGKSPDKLLMLLRTGRTVGERSQTAVCERMGWSRNRLSKDLKLLRQIAAGEGVVEPDSLRKGVVMFLQTYDELAPTKEEFRRYASDRARESRTMTPAQAASLVERMATLRRHHLNGDGSARA